jgi:hypothetical protein
MPSTGASTDGFGRQFGIGRGGDASRQLIGNVEALCQSIDPGRVFIATIYRILRIKASAENQAKVTPNQRSSAGFITKNAG